MPDEYVSIHCKIARDEKQALSYVIKSQASNGFVVFKKGGTGQLLSVEIDNQIV